MRFMQRSLMGLFLLALTVGLLALAGGTLRSSLEERMNRESKQRPARERVFTVNVIKAEAKTTTPTIITFGEVRARRTLDLRLPVGGTIVEMSQNLVEGGEVRKGELLIRLDAADAQFALDVATSELRETEAEIREAAAALLLARDELEAARAQVALREAALVRQQDLRSRGVGTEAAVETAALAVAAAAQSVLGKRQSLAMAEARVTRAETGRARQEIRLQDARRRLADTTLYAEFDGISGSVTAIKGGRISANEKLGRLIDPEALEVAFRLSNGQFLRLVSGGNSPLGRQVLVRLEILGADLVAEGRIERIGAEVGEGQTGRQVFAALSNGKVLGFRSGDFVQVEVDEPPLTNTVTLPATAVDAAGRLLVLGEGERLEEITAEVLRKQGDLVILSASGIAGREVVEARTPLIGTGIKVNPKRRDNAGAAAIPQEPEMIALSPERRARLVDFVSGNANLPKAAKERLLARLKEERVPAAMVNRIESRMGG